MELYFILRPVLCPTQNVQKARGPLNITTIPTYTLPV